MFGAPLIHDDNDSIRINSLTHLLEGIARHGKRNARSGARRTSSEPAQCPRCRMPSCASSPLHHPRASDHARYQMASADASSWRCIAPRYSAERWRTRAACTGSFCVLHAPCACAVTQPARSTGAAMQRDVCMEARADAATALHQCARLPGARIVPAPDRCARYAHA